MMKTWWKRLDKNEVNGALSTDLQKAFDCLLHDLLIEKLAVNGSYCKSWYLIQVSLSKRQPRPDIKKTSSNISDIIFGVFQGWIPDCLLLNIYICDMFSYNNDCEFANYADANTPYCSNWSLYILITNWKYALAAFKWFQENQMKPKTD